MTPASKPCRPCRALLVNYHYCRTAEDSNPTTAITTGDLDRQLANALARWQALGANDLPLTGGCDGARTGFLVTFDDGMRGVIENALPVLDRYRMSAIVFCCSQPYLEKRVLNVQKTHLLRESWGWDGFRARFMAALAEDPESEVREDAFALQLDRMYRYDEPQIAAFKRLLNVELPYAVVTRVLDRLFESQYGAQEEAVRHLYLSLDDLRRCVDKGLAIGIHTHSHCMLSRLSPGEQAREIDTPLGLFREELGLPVTLLSYPYGIKGSWNDVTKEISRSRGLRGACTLGRTIYDPADSDQFEIPRFDVNDIFTAEGAVKIEM